MMLDIVCVAVSCASMVVSVASACFSLRADYIA